MDDVLAEIRASWAASARASTESIAKAAREDDAATKRAQQTSRAFGERLTASVTRALPPDVAHDSAPVIDREETPDTYLTEAIEVPRAFPDKEPEPAPQPQPEPVRLREQPEESLENLPLEDLLSGPVYPVGHRDDDEMNGRDWLGD